MIKYVCDVCKKEVKDENLPGINLLHEVRGIGVCSDCLEGTQNVIECFIQNQKRDYVEFIKSLTS